MLYYLDSAIVIYAVEGNPTNQQRALNHLAALELAGHRFAISELTRTECLVPVFGPGGGQRLSDFFRFFHGPNLRTLILTSAMHERAGAIRGGHTYPAIPPAQPTRYGMADALHLAAAIEFGCDVFLTNDNQLANFPDITIEVLP
ncbi:MAG: type II toxin-antitoxin system VapC family toxin [Gemmataceae bacterium]|nr:type II toxin-antitoxin system VapC family toxin [Gemmataceae bacterium]